MNKHLKYLKYVLKHKYLVAKECFRLGYYFAGIFHDISKFRPSEWFPYVEYFYGRYSEKQNGYELKDIENEKVQKDIDYAWNRHIHRNKHHWQYWVLREGNGNLKILDIPYKYIVESVCDWQGASKAIRGPEATAFEWYEKMKNKIILSEKTRLLIETLLQTITARDNRKKSK